MADQSGSTAVADERRRAAIAETKMLRTAGAGRALLARDDQGVATAEQRVEQRRHAAAT